MVERSIAKENKIKRSNATPPSDQNQLSRLMRDTRRHEDSDFRGRVSTVHRNSRISRVQPASGIREAEPGWIVGVGKEKQKRTGGKYIVYVSLIPFYPVAAAAAAAAVAEFLNVDIPILSFETLRNDAFIIVLNTKGWTGREQERWIEYVADMYRAGEDFVYETG